MFPPPGAPRPPGGPVPGQFPGGPAGAPGAFTHPGGPGAFPPPGSSGAPPPGMLPPPGAPGAFVPGGPRPVAPGGLLGAPGAAGMPPQRPPSMSGVPPPPGHPGMPQPPGAPGMPPPRPPGMVGMPPPPGMHGMPPPPGAPAGAFPPPPGLTGPPGMRPPGPPGPSMGPPPPGPPGMMPPPPSAGGAPPGFMGPPPPGPPGPHGAFPPPPGMMGQPGMMGPPPGHPGPPGMGGPPPPPGMHPPGMPGFGGYGAQQLADQFETLAIGGIGPGAPEGIDLNSLPRPVGALQERALAAPPPFDAASCSADNMRLTVNAIPNSVALRQRWSLPLGVVVHPMSDEARGRAVPVVNLGGAGIIRCRRCRTYMNPFMGWKEGGRRFQCNVCGLLNEVPHEYFCNVDESGRRRDAGERPELSCGTVEYVAPAEYMVRPPMPPIYFFAIDVSYAAVSSGMLASACASIASCLDRLLGDERTLVGFLTYDSALHFYNLKSSLSAPQMMVVAELDDPFVPLPDDLLVNLRESRTVVDALLSSLPNTFAGTSVVESAAGPALQAAFMVTQHLGGKLLMFQAAVPSSGVGKTKNRENLAAYGTDKEGGLRSPEDPFFKRFAAECSRVQLTVDIFAFSLAYMDLASWAALPRYTCGELYHYPGFSAARDGPKLAAEVTHNLTRPTAWEAVMRIRCSKGLRIASFHGHFFNRSTDLLALPTCDPDKAFAVQIAHEETVVQGPVAYVQCALLYTNSQGERRIRVHTLCVPVVSELSDLYRATDAAATATLLAKLAVERSLGARLDETRQQLQAKVVGALKEFRLLNANAASRLPAKLLYPDTLRYLPLWVLGAMKSAALRGGAKDVNADERIAVGYELMSAPVDALCRAAYPDMYPLHDTGGEWGIEGQDGSLLLPPTMPLTAAFTDERGAYLLDNGRVFVLWCGRALDRGWSTDVFGVDIGALSPQDAAGVKPEPAREGSQLSRRVCNVLAALRAGRPLHAQVFVVRQGSPLEVHVGQYFVEDRGPATPSYADWMMGLHKAVLSK